MNVKLKWRVSAAPTGRFRSFEHRSWPSAEWPNGAPAASLHCEDDYTPARGRGEHLHAPLIVYVKAYRADGSGWDNRRLKGRPLTLAAAKELVDKFFDVMPDMRPPDYRKV